MISGDGQYRYWLRRCWAHDGAMPMTFIMLNPSTADADIDDPTIRRCIGFARREGYESLEVVNLFAFRATKPDALRAVVDPVGPDNDNHLRAQFETAGTEGTHVVAGWGDAVPRRLVGRITDVMSLATEAGVPLWCLGRAQSGAPRHPLYMKSDAPLEEWL